ncbi:hypothetical protein JCM25156A_28840 [Komagataeibacter kakiaceti JCM 25156]
MGAEVADSATRAATALRGFEDMLDSIAATEETVTAASAIMGDGLIDVIVRGAEPLGEALDAAGAQGVVMGNEIAEGAARATTALDGLMARVREAREQMTGMVADVRDGPIGTATGGVRDAAHGFSESLQHAMHNGMTAAMATVGMLEPIHAAAEYDNTLVHIGIGDELHGGANRAFVADYGRHLDALARATGQRGNDLAEAAGFYNREGYSADRVNAVMPTTAHIATAYNAAPDAVARSAFALQESLGITDQQLGGALASVALAGKSADLPFEKLAPLLPQAAATAGVFGMHGRGGVDDLASALAVVRKSTGYDSEAVTDVKQLLVDLNQGHTAQRFRHYGVDMFGEEERARHNGTDPLLAMMNVIRRVTNNGTDARAMGDLFRNHDSFVAAAALMRHWDQYDQIHQRTSGADQSVINEDFTTGIGSTQIRLQAFEEALSQINRRIGEGFVPTLNMMTAALNHGVEAWDWLDRHVPGATSVLTGTIGAVLGLTAAFSALKVVGGPARAAISLLLSPLRSVIGLSRTMATVMGLGRVATIGLGGGFLAVAGIIVAAIGDIALHWDRFSGMFHAIGHGAMEELRGLGNFVAGVFTGDWERAMRGIGQAMRGLGGGFAGEFGIVRQLFLDFVHWLDGWTGGLPSRMLASLSAEWHVLTDGIGAQLGRLEQTFDNSWVGRHLGFNVQAAAPHPVVGAPALVPAPAVSVPVPAAAVSGAGGAALGLHVSADRGLQIHQTAGPAGIMTIAQPNRGRMVDRP